MLQTDRWKGYLLSELGFYTIRKFCFQAPTTVLVNPDGRTLEAFGYEAENKYAELAEEKMHYKYYYFKRFKMMLHEKMVGYGKYPKISNTKVSVKMPYANSADPDQTAPEDAV